MLDKQRLVKTGMPSIKLEEEIDELQSESVKLRNQMDKLEEKEAKIAEKISMKRKQLDTQLQFNFN